MGPAAFDTVGHSSQCGRIGHSNRFEIRLDLSQMPSKVCGFTSFGIKFDASQVAFRSCGDEFGMVTVGDLQVQSQLQRLDPTVINFIRRIVTCQYTLL